MATKTKTAKLEKGKAETPKKDEPKEAKAPSKRGFGNMKWKMEQVITLLVDYNPKRANTDSHTRFDLYEDGMTVKDALDAGIMSGDLNWDTEHKFIKIEEEFDEDVEKKSKPVKAAKAEPTKPVTGKVTIIPKGKGKKAKAEIEEEEEEEEEA